MNKKHQELLRQVVGEMVGEAREKRRVSIRALAKEVGISPSLVAHIEAGRKAPSVYTLHDICEELLISLDDIAERFDMAKGNRP